MQLGKVLGMFRIIWDMTMAEAAQKCEISYGYMTELESGEKMRLS